MRRELKSQILIVAVFVTALGCAFIQPWHVRAADSGYKQVENWAQLPAGTQWGSMTSVGVDSKGNVYAFQREEPDARIIVFDSDGKYRRTFALNVFEYPHGINVSADGSVWATDRKMQQVIKFDQNGKILLTLGKKDVNGDNDSQDSFNGASGSVVAKNGDVFISDGEGGNSRVVKFSKDGKFIKAWGTKGSDPGQFSTPHGISMDSKGNVWVCDRGNKRIQEFDQDGKFLNQMTQFGTPVAMAFAKDDTMFVADGAPENQVVIGKTDGTVLDKIEGLNAAHGIAVDSNGSVYIAESGGKAVLKYVKK